MGKAASTPPTTPLTTLNGTTLATAGSTGGKYNTNTNTNIKAKDDNNPSPPSEDSQVGIAFDCDHALTELLEFLSDKLRKEFLQVCENLKLSLDEATQLAYEFRARQIDAQSRPELKIQHPKKWLEAVVISSRASGTEILNAGSELQANAVDLHNCERDRQSKAAKQIKKEIRAAKLNQLVIATIASLTDIQIGTLKQEALGLLAPFIRPKCEEEVDTKLDQRCLPAGLAGHATKRALLELEHIPTSQRTDYAEWLGVIQQ